VKIKFLEFIDYIKKYLGNIQTNFEYCDKFYSYMNTFDVEFNENNYDFEFNIYCKIMDIEEQAEPWNDVKYFKPLDDQLRELLKKYKL
jgi:hypothetical protein